MIQYPSHVMNGMEFNGLVKHLQAQHTPFAEKNTATSVLIASKLAPPGIMDSHHQQTQKLTLCAVSAPAKPAKTVSYGTESTGKVFHLFILLILNAV